MQLSWLNNYDLGVGCGESRGGCSGSSFGGDGGHVALLDALLGWIFGMFLSPDELAYLQGQVAAICINEDRLLDCIEAFGEASSASFSGFLRHLRVWSA